jgi:dual oxidase maturation factor 1
MNLLLVVVPRYGGYTMIVTGLLMMGSAFAYHCLLPTTPLRVRFEDMLLTFKFGWCFWLIIIAGEIMEYLCAVLLKRKNTRA